MSVSKGKEIFLLFNHFFQRPLRATFSCYKTLPFAAP